MIWRALAAFLALPGVFAFAVPIAWILLTGSDLAAPALVAAGGTVWIVGVVGLLWCVRDFFVTGRGTLAPWDPARELVVVGLYRVSRNPMYVSVLLILAGWVLVFGSPALGIYAVAVAVAFHVRVVLGEEPYLQRQFGAQWRAYRARVPRWLGRVAAVTRPERG